MTARVVGEDERRDLCADRGVILNGHPAIISGVRETFAMVRRLDNGTGYQWAWETVANVVAKGGRFHGRS